MRGWLSFIASARTSDRQVSAYARLQRLLEWYARQEVLPFDAQAALYFDELKRSRVRVGSMDLKIAAIALSRGATLISRNISDFARVPRLRIEDWTRAT